MIMEYKKPRRIFEDSGVVNPEDAYHVLLDNVANTKGQDIKTMVDMGRYFSIFAPRQSGKTTFFEDFCSRLKEDQTYIPILLSFQDYKNLDPSRFYQSIQKDLHDQLINRLGDVQCTVQDEVSKYFATHVLRDHIDFRELFEELNRIVIDKKIIIFIDEFDGIPIDELENFLTTLRELYQRYKKQKDKALYSVSLVGIRNITKLILGGVSPFNIADQVKLPPFSLKNIRDLYGQYTKETNQPFTDEAVKHIYEETAGQPWLVNRLGTILTVDIKPDTTESIIEEDVDNAIRNLLKERNSHFDNLLEKAKLNKETFIEIVFNGVEYNPDDEEQSWLEQYGLVKEKDGLAIVANPMYKKRFLKAFFYEVADKMDISSKRYYLTDGNLNMENILGDFEKYIAQIGAVAFYSTNKPMEVTGKFQLTAWLYQFVPAGVGSLYHESKTGLGAMDILLHYRQKKYIIETKINRYPGTIDDAIEQLTEKYLLPERVDHGYVVIFDPKTKVGELCTPRIHRVKDKEILSFNIGIGK